MLVSHLAPAHPRPPAPPRKPHPTATAATAADATQPIAGVADAEAEQQLLAAADVVLLRREQNFDLATKQRAEDQREADVLRDLAMAQLKKDDENMKKWIALI